MVRTGPEALIGTETSARSLAKTIAATRFLTMTASDIVALVAHTCLANPTLGVTFNLDSPPTKSSARGYPAPFPLTGFDALELADAPASLYEHVARQIPLLIRDRALLPVAEAWLESLEPSGWTSSSAADIAKVCGVGEQLAEQVLALLQAAEPDGLFARNLRECLAIQCRAQAKMSSQMELLLDNLPMLAKGDLRELVASVGIPKDELPGLISQIRQLNPKPGAQFDSNRTHLPPTDLLLEQNSDGQWELHHNSWLRPTLDLKSNAGKVLAKDLRAASVFTTMLSRRDDLVFRAAQQAVSFHTPYLDGLLPYPRPMTLADVAVPLAVHETTIGRIRTHVTISDGRHAMKLRSLFLPAAALMAREPISAQELTHRIRNLLASDAYLGDPRDEMMRMALQAQGVETSRRTVAKYRSLLQRKGYATNS